MGRRLGQHFLNNPAILRRIALAACPGIEPLVVEIGPGKGALTRHLLERAERVIAIELDRDLARRLEGTDPRLSVHCADVLETDLSQWGPAVVAGNLPYYITSPIIEKVLHLGVALRRAVLLVQKEVAERLTASPGSRDYGYLTVATQITASVETMFTIARGAFSPPPNVDSAAVRLTPKPAPVENLPVFLEFAGRCFRHKRKNLRNNLGPYYYINSKTVGDAATLRAEQLSIPQLVDLYRRLNAA
jgi:16S rRNA (adenine1518-N6/adenine1519-N6)-dimethyltransferase